ARAESVALTRERALPQLPDGAEPAALTALAGQLVVQGQDTGWALAPGAAAWRPVRLPDDGGLALLATAVDGPRGYRLLGDDALQRIEALAWSGDRLVATPVPALPEPLRDPRTAVLGDALYLVGLAADGRARLWFLPRTGTGHGAWRSLDGWPGDAVPQALAAQKAALYLAAADGALWRWTADAGWSRRAALPAAAIPGQAGAIGQAHLLYLLQSPGGAQPRLFHVITEAWADWPGATPASAAGLVHGDGVLWR